MKEFTCGQGVYDDKGNEYLYLEKSNDGHYANKIITVQTTFGSSDDFEEHELEGEIVFLKQVYDQPPIAKMNDEIKALSEQKKELADCVYDLNRQANILKERKDAVKSDLEKEIRAYPHYDTFLHLASGGELIRISEGGEIIKYHEGEVFKYNVETGTLEARCYVDWEDGEESNKYSHNSTSEKMYGFSSKAKARKWLMSHPEMLVVSVQISQHRGIMAKYAVWGNVEKVLERHEALGVPLNTMLTEIKKAYEADMKEQRIDSAVAKLQSTRNQIANLREQESKINDEINEM